MGDRMTGRLVGGTAPVTAAATGNGRAQRPNCLRAMEVAPFYLGWWLHRRLKSSNQIRTNVAGEYVPVSDGLMLV
jgi:hypothetical protein